MAKNLGTFTFAANLKVKAAEALDPRMVAASKADLIKKKIGHLMVIPFMYTKVLLQIVELMVFTDLLMNLKHYLQIIVDGKESMSEV